VDLGRRRRRRAARVASAKEELTVRLALALVLGPLVLSCASGPGDGAGLGSGASAIVGGQASPASEDAVVLLRNVRGECTGTLVAPNLVVTARHCVAPANLAMICNERGETVSGGEPGADYEPSKIAVYTGSPLARAGVLDPKAVGAKIVHDGAPRLCDHDLAFLVLSNDVAGPVAKVRLTEPPVVGETFRAVGWGLAETTTVPDARVSRGGVRVTGVGPNRTTTTGPHELSATEGICDGDSGGPALSEKDGAILGVVTRGGSPRAAKLKPPEACRGDDIVNVYVSLAAHAKTVQDAFRAAGRPVPEAPAPDPCAAARCAAGTTCVVSGGAATCEAPAPSDPAPEGCTTGPGGASSTGALAAIAVLGLAFVRRRRP